MTPVLSAFSGALLHFTWQGLLVFVLLWLTLLALRKHSAAARYFAGCVALAVLAAAPLVTTYSLYRTRPAAAYASAAAVSTSPPPGARAQLPLSRQTPWLMPVEPWVLPAWALGVLAFSLRMVWGCAQVAALRRGGQPADAPVQSMIESLSVRMGLTGKTRVLISAWAGGPSLVGWLRPVILMPASAITGLTPQQLEAVLAHELAHVRRHDYLVNWMQVLVETVLFYHPAVWWVSSRIRHERELCCDDLAVSACDSPLCYARALTNLEKMRAASTWSTQPTQALGSTGGALFYRIQRIMGANTQPYVPPKASGLAALSLALACLVLTVHWAQGQNQPQPDYLLQGDVLLRTAANELALQKYREGMASDPNRRVVYQKRCIEVLMRLGKRSEAFAINAQILREHPDDTEALALGAVSLLDQGAAAAAVTQLQQVIARTPDNPVAHFDLGLAYAAQHQDVAARREMEEAILLRPDFARAQEELQDLERKTASNRYEETLARLQSESAQSPERLELMQALGNVAVRAGKYDQAIYTFQKMLDRLDQGSPQRGDVYFRLGEAYQRKGDSVAAIDALEKARELSPDHREVLIALLTALEAAGRGAEAAQIRESAEAVRANQAALTTNFLKDELKFEEKRLEAAQSRSEQDLESIRQAQTRVEEVRRRLQIALQVQEIGATPNEIAKPRK